MNGWLLAGLAVAAVGVLIMASPFLADWLESRRFAHLPVVDVDAELEAEHEQARERLNVRHREFALDRREPLGPFSDWFPKGEEEWRG